MMMGAFVLIDGTELSLFCAIFAILHEFCHIIVLKREGGGVKSLETKTVGISLETGQISYKSEIKIALAGPVFNFACFVIFGLFCYFSSFNKTFLKILKEEINIDIDKIKHLIISVALLCCYIIVSFPLSSYLTLYSTTKYKIISNIAKIPATHIIFQILIFFDNFIIRLLYKIFLLFYQ